MTKIFDNPANEMEREIAEYIKPLLTPEAEEKIEKDKLTLDGCLKHCYRNGKKYEVKTTGGGIARISEEQHFKWVREYFGISGAAHIKQRQAYNFIKALDEFGESGLQSNASLGITKLTALATLCADDREQLMQSVDVANISTRELEEKVAELKKKCEQLELELDTTKTEKEAEMQVVVEAASKADEKMNQAKEEKRRLEEKLTELQARYDELKSRPVEVAVAEPTEEQKTALRKEIEAKVKEENSKAVNHAQQEKQKAEEKAKQLEKEIEALQATAKNSAPSGRTKELLKFHFSNIQTAFNAAAEIISTMEYGEEKEKFKAALKKLVEECGKAAEV